LLYPLHWNRAGALFRREETRVGLERADLVLEIKTAYYRYQALEETRKLLVASLESAQAAAELSARQKRAGNINVLDQSMQEEIKQDAFLDLTRLASDLSTEKENLLRLLGVEPEGTALTLAEAPTDLPSAANSREALSRTPSTGQPDLAAASEQVEVADNALWSARLERLPSLRGGFVLETEASREFAGPKIQLELPLDLGGNAVGKARNERDAALHRLAARRARVIAETRAAHARMETARAAAVYYRDTVIPLRERIVDETLKHYNFMLQGVYQLIGAWRNECAARRGFIDARRDFWIARAQLERALGAPVPSTADADSSGAGQ
jgi:cobalt-zinc-cadmium efflux system outer membrane protein